MQLIFLYINYFLKPANLNSKLHKIAIQKIFQKCDFDA